VYVPNTREGEGPREQEGPRRSTRLHNKGAARTHRDCPGCLTIGEKRDVQWKEGEEVKYYFSCAYALGTDEESEVEAYKIEPEEVGGMEVKHMKLDHRLRGSIELVTVWKGPKGAIRVLIRNSTGGVIRVKKGQSLLSAFRGVKE
jgi:hypothetical protein